MGICEQFNVRSTVKTVGLVILFPRTACGPIVAHSQSEAAGRLLWRCCAVLHNCDVPCIAVRVIRNDMSRCDPGELGNIVVKWVMHCTYPISRYTQPETAVEPWSNYYYLRVRERLLLLQGHSVPNEDVYTSLLDFRQWHFMRKKALNGYWMILKCAIINSVLHLARVR